MYVHEYVFFIAAFYQTCGRIKDDRVLLEHVNAGTQVDKLAVSRHTYKKIEMQTFFSISFLQYPWSAAIVRVINETYHQIHCHGSLITSDLILSAGHCYKDKKIIPDLFIVLGSLEPLKEGIKKDKKRNLKTIYEIQEVVLHKDYDK